jgi:hypothetical protein
MQNFGFGKNNTKTHFRRMQTMPESTMPFNWRSKRGRLSILVRSKRRDKVGFLIETRPSNSFFYRYFWQIKNYLWKRIQNFRHFEIIRSRCEFEMVRCIYEIKFGYNITPAYVSFLRANFLEFWKRIFGVFA